MGWVHLSWRFGHAEALRDVSPEMLERGSKTSAVPVVWGTFGIFFSAWSKWFPVTTVGHGGNLLISLWPGDKVTISGVAAQRLTPPLKIPSAKIRWKISHLDFLASKRHPPHCIPSTGPNYQRWVLLISGDAFNPLNAELNPICHLLALLGGSTIVVVSRLRVKGYFEGKTPVNFTKGVLFLHDNAPAHRALST